MILVCSKTTSKLFWTQYYTVCVFVCKVDFCQCLVLLHRFWGRYAQNAHYYSSALTNTSLTVCGPSPVLILQPGQGALELLLVLVLELGEEHVLTAGGVRVQGWAGVTQEVLIFIPESPTQETAHWANSTQPPAAQSRTSRMQRRPPASRVRSHVTECDAMRGDRMEWERTLGEKNTLLFQGQRN